MKPLAVSLLLICQVIGFHLVHGQQVVISGSVRDENGPLPGANIVEKGTTKGTQSDFEGNFTLEVSNANATLEFSYIGYKSVVVALGGKNSLDIIMEGSYSRLDEAVIIGYGTTTVKDATGAIVGVRSKDFNRGQIFAPEQLIQGKAAGVQITVTSGEPGAGIETRIRGGNSIRSDNNPLFVVDGIPLDGRATTTTGSNRPPRNPLNFLNPSEIASISVLKDASATAIYGSRGANGVVIITTKSGRVAGEGDFEFSSSASIAYPARKYDLLNREEFLAGVAELGGDSDAADEGGNTDWQDYVTTTSISEDLHFSWSRNYGKGDLFAAVGYADQRGIVKKSSLERITGRFNWSHRFIGDKLKLSFRGTLTEINDEFNEEVFFQEANNLVFSSPSALGPAYTDNPTIPISVQFLPGGPTPSGILENQQIKGVTDRYLFNVSLEYTLTPWLSAKMNSGYDDSKVTKISLNNGADDDTAASGSGVLFDIHRVSKLLEATLTLQKDFGNSSLEALLGYSYQSFRTSGRNVSGRGFRTTDLHQMDADLQNALNAAAATVKGSFQQFYYGTNWANLRVNRLFNENGEPEVVAGADTPVQLPKRLQAINRLQALTADYYDNRDELQSFFGRINYSIAEKYLFTFTLRADGSSRFGPENRYGYFPSGAFAWQLGEEEFIGPAISTLKLRLSAGVTGNQEGLGYGNFVSRQRFSPLSIDNSNAVGQNGLTIVATDVPDLKWETTTDFNIGLDWGFNLDRLTGSIDVYRRETRDLLLQRPPAAPSTNPFIFGNVDAKVINQGVEFSFGYDFVQTTYTNFGASFNIAYNKNEIRDFFGTVPTGRIWGPGLNGSNAQRFEAGQPLASFYMAEFTGFDSNGNPTYRDIDEDGIGDNNDDKYFVGKNALPDVTSGLSLDFRHRNWFASASFYGQFGFSVYNNTANAFFNAGQLANGGNVTRNVLGNGENPSASADVSTRFLERGDFVRLQNATIGYEIPLPDTKVIKSLLINITGQNLFLITNYSGLDPEVNTDGANFLNNIPVAGMDYLAYPRPRIITFGAMAKF
jgi:iron complex outermembrane receptor protein